MTFPIPWCLWRDPSFLYGNLGIIPIECSKAATSFHSTGWCWVWDSHGLSKFPCACWRILAGRIPRYFFHLATGIDRSHCSVFSGAFQISTFAGYHPSQRVRISPAAQLDNWKGYTPVIGWSQNRQINQSQFIVNLWSPRFLQRKHAPGPTSSHLGMRPEKRPTPRCPRKLDWPGSSACWQPPSAWRKRSRNLSPPKNGEVLGRKPWFYYPNVSNILAFF